MEARSNLLTHVYNMKRQNGIEDVPTSDATIRDLLGLPPTEMPDIDFGPLYVIIKDTVGLDTLRELADKFIPKKEG